jgi:hypothetical protein
MQNRPENIEEIAIPASVGVYEQPLVQRSASFRAEPGAAPNGELLTAGRNNHGPDGRFIKANVARVTHGFRRNLAHDPGALADIAALASAIEQDLGGDLTAIARSQVEDFATLAVLINRGVRHLAALTGDDEPLIVTGKGRSRAIVQELRASILAKARLAGELGYSRIAKDAGVLDIRDDLARPQSKE